MRKSVPASAVPKAWLVLIAALTMIVFEGAFRKWVPPFQEGIGKYMMYFSKDIIFAMILFLPVRSAPMVALKVFQKWLWPGCALMVIGAFLSSLHGFSLAGAMLTARACIVLPILALLAVPRLAGLPLHRVALLLAAFTILNFALGVEQNRLASDNILNRYSDANIEVVTEDTGVRATGTFSYITGMSIICAVGIWAGMVLMSLAVKQWQRIGAWVTLAASFGCGLASISRAPIVIGVAMIGGWLTASKDGLSVLARGLVIGTCCLVAAMALGLSTTFAELGQGLMQRSDRAGDSFSDRAFGQLDEMVTAIQEAPLGEGFGTHQAAAYYVSNGNVELSRIESQLPRMVLETGFLGLIGYLMVCAGGILALQKAKREAPSSGTRAALLATQMFLLPMFYALVIFDHTASAFVWMILAAVLGAAEMQPNQKLKIETLKVEKGNEQEAAKQFGRRTPKFGRAIYPATATQSVGITKT